MFWSSGGILSLKKEELAKEKNRLVEEIRLKNQAMQDQICLSSTPLIMCGDLLNRTFNQVQQDEQVRSAQNSYNLIKELKEMLYKSVRLPDNQIIIMDFLIRARASGHIGRKHFSAKGFLLPLSRYSHL